MFPIMSKIHSRITSFSIYRPFCALSIASGHINDVNDQRIFGKRLLYVAPYSYQNTYRPVTNLLNDGSLFYYFSLKFRHCETVFVKFIAIDFANRWCFQIMKSDLSLGAEALSTDIWKTILWSILFLWMKITKTRLGPWRIKWIVKWCCLSSQSMKLDTVVITNLLL